LARVPATPRRQRGHSLGPNMRMDPDRKAIVPACRRPVLHFYLARGRGRSRHASTNHMPRFKLVKPASADCSDWPRLFIRNCFSGLEQVPHLIRAKASLRPFSRYVFGFSIRQNLWFPASMRSSRHISPSCLCRCPRIIAPGLASPTDQFMR